nr:hypothetical protein [Bacteroidota bacterium]
MRISKSTIWLLFLFMNAHWMFAQTKVKQIPNKYLTPNDTVGKPYQSDPVAESSAWYVFSDREANPFYATPASDVVKGTFAFREKLAVLNIQGNRLEVARVADIHKNRLIPGNPSYFIDYDKLLLWSECMVSLPYKFDKKAMVLNIWRENNIESLKQKPKYYDIPSIKDSKEIAEAGTYQIRYVYKQIPGFVLVGNDPNIDLSGDPGDVIIGWVPTSHITPWDHRIAWELNWHPSAAAERKWTDHSINVERGVLIFDSLDAARTYIEIAPITDIGQVEKVAYPETPIYSTRQPGKFDRFPVLNNDTKIIEGFDPYEPQRVGVIGDISTEHGKLDKAVYNKLIQDVLSIEENQRKVNVIFVVDATFSMEEYAESIAIALDSAMNFINRDQEKQKTKNEFRFGAILYRDEAEDFPIHQYKNYLTEDIYALGDWIKAHMDKKYYGKDRDLPEALYYGIQQAIDVYAPDEKQTNYIIVIGDAGDHQSPGKTKTFVKEDALINKLAGRKCNLLAYQVHRPDEIKQDSTYRDFEKQINRIMMKTAEKIKEHEVSEATVQNDLLISQPIQLRTNAAHTFFRLSPNSPVFGQLRTSLPNDTLSIDTLQVEITKNIKRIHRYINEKISEIARIIEGDSITSSGETAAGIIYDLLAKGTSFEDLQMFISEKRQVYKEGFVAFKLKNHTYPNFQNVIFIEETDLNGLKENIRNLVLATRDTLSPNIIRNRVDSTMKRIYISYVGRTSPEEMNNKPFGELLYLLTGLPTRDKYKKWTINLINDPAEVSDADLVGFSRDIYQTMARLTEIINMGNDYKSVIRDVGNSDIYYWIPGDVFPHNAKPDDVGGILN